MAEAKSDLALDAIGSSVRRAIIDVLSQGARPVGEIAAEFPVSRPAISKHLRILEAANLVRSEARGSRNWFHLNDEGFESARAWLDSFWDEALIRFALVAENLDETHQ